MSGFDSFDDDAFFDAFSDAEFDALGLDDDRAAFAAAMGPIPTDDTGSIDRQQWYAAFSEYIKTGQITEQQVQNVLDADDAAFDEFGDVVLDLTTDSPDGDTL